MGADGWPHGVSGLTVATGWYPSSFWRPVPPMTAMWTGPGGGESESSRELVDEGFTIEMGREVCHGENCSREVATINGRL